LVLIAARRVWWLSHTLAGTEVNAWFWRQDFKASASQRKTRMNLLTASFLAALAIAPLPVLAHGERPQPAHGGELQDAQGVWVEFLVKGRDVSVYVISEDHKPVPAQQISGTATVLIEGKSYKVDLSPGDANSVKGTLPVAASGKLIATVALKVGGKSASARFMGTA